MIFTNFAYTAILVVCGVNQLFIPDTCEDIIHAKNVVRTAKFITGYQETCGEQFSVKLTDNFIAKFCTIPVVDTNLSAEEIEKQTAQQLHEYCPTLQKYVAQQPVNATQTERSVRLHALRQRNRLDCSKGYITSCRHNDKKSDSATVTLDIFKKEKPSQQSRDM